MGCGPSANTVVTATVDASGLVAKANV